MAAQFVRSVQSVSEPQLSLGGLYLEARVTYWNLIGWTVRGVYVGGAEILPRPCRAHTQIRDLWTRNGGTADSWPVQRAPSDRFYILRLLQRISEPSSELIVTVTAR